MRIKISLKKITKIVPKFQLANVKSTENTIGTWIDDRMLVMGK